MVWMVVTASALSGASPVQTAWTVLTGASKSTNPVTRKQAITSLEVAGRLPRALALVETALNDKDVEVREAAVNVLCAVKSKSSIPKLQAAVNDAAPEVSFAAARALWALGDTSGRDILVAVAEGDRASSSGLIKEQMRDAVKKLHNPAALAMIGMKEGAGAFLGPFGIGLLVFDELRKDGSATARTLSVAALASDTDPKTLEVLAAALSDKNRVVRAAAAKALATRGDPAMIAKLEPSLQDKVDAVKYIAAAAIIRLGAMSRQFKNRLPVTSRPAAVKR